MSKAIKKLFKKIVNALKAAIDEERIMMDAFYQQFA